jgi:hypothetical protein
LARAIYGDVTMAGFGRKNARDTMLRAIMIHTAAEALSKEAEVSRVLYPNEMVNIFNSVVAEQDIEPSVDEYNYAMVGAKTLFNQRDFVQEILERWRDHDARLESADIRRSRNIFSNTLQDFIHHG